MKASIIPLLLTAHLLMGSSSVSAGEPLPSPLTLEFALSLADEGHPRVEQALAESEKAGAEHDLIASRDAVKLNLTTRLWAIDTAALAFDRSHNDSNVRMALSKRLYDFGYQERSLAAAEGELRGSEWELLGTRQAHRIEVMARYFDVLVADLAAARDNEAMAVAYVQLDRGQNRHELGELSDVVLAELEHGYQEARSRRLASEQQLRLQRQRLANALNRPGELSPVLEMPALPELQRQKGDPEALTTQALKASPELQALRERVAAAEQRSEAARASHGPSLRAEVVATDYHREGSSNHPFEGGLVFEVPIFDGGLRDADVARERAQLHQLQALLAGAELDVREKVLELWQQLELLRVQGEELDALGRYRELYLDRSRTLYDLEVNADLGDAMTLISDLRLKQAENQFNIALAWAKLDSLTGKAVHGLLPTTSTTNDNEEKAP